MKKEKIATVVVTYNRKGLLRECLNSLLKQTYAVDSIIIMDNASTDGTEEMLKKEFLDNKIFDYINLGKNIGGAGGFHHGIKRAYQDGFDWVWVMDDDTMPTEDALSELISAKEYLVENNEKIGFLASNVFWTDGNPCKMNVPPIKKGSEKIYKYLNDGIVEINSSSFVSMLINRSIIAEIGLPIEEFFIWLDDVEYSLRMAKKTKGFLVGKSKVIHQTKFNYSPNYKTFKKDELWKYKYEMKNRVYLAKNAHSFKGKLIMWLRILVNFFSVLFSKNSKYFPEIFLSLLKGLFFNPIIKKADN